MISLEYNYFMSLVLVNLFNYFGSFLYFYKFSVIVIYLVG